MSVSTSLPGTLAAAFSLTPESAEVLVNGDRTAPLSGLIFAVNMLVNTHHGDAYSFEEIASWLSDAGFVNPRTIESPGPSPLILATKP